jgi:hypothetical protein
VTVPVASVPSQSFGQLTVGPRLFAGPNGTTTASWLERDGFRTGREVGPRSHRRFRCAGARGSRELEGACHPEATRSPPRTAPPRPLPEVVPGIPETPGATRIDVFSRSGSVALQRVAERVNCRNQVLFELRPGPHPSPVNRRVVGSNPTRGAFSSTLRTKGGSVNAGPPFGFGAPSPVGRPPDRPPRGCPTPTDPRRPPEKAEGRRPPLSRRGTKDGVRSPQRSAGG